MFIGSWKINLIISIIAFFIVFIGSMATNTLTTSIFRSFLAFLLFYLISFIFRWLWKIALKSNDDLVSDEVHPEGEVHPEIEDNTNGDHIRKVDYSAEDIEKASQYVKELIDE